MRILAIFHFLLLFCTLPALADLPREIEALLQSAQSQIGQTVEYDGSYRVIAYPGGDVPLTTGVCTDVVIRAYRALGFDLQKLVHEDMKAHFAEYPSGKIWGLSRPDSNIDHRRVPNLQTFFARQGISFAPGVNDEPPLPGDLLSWDLPGNLPHIGIVSDRKTQDGSQYLVIHNIGSGAKEEDVIGRFRLTGHYRYRPWRQAGR